MKEEILREIPGANVMEAVYEPVMGAVVMGLQSVYGEIPEAIYQKMEETSKQFPTRRLEKKSDRL